MRSSSRLLAVSAALVSAAVASSASAAINPILQLSFPASWAGTGTGTVVTDLSPAHNNGIISTTAANQPSLSAVIPPDGTAGTQTLLTDTLSGGQAGGTQTTNRKLLQNPTLAVAGGFQYAGEFLWDGSPNPGNGGIQKIMDYSGTESLQLDTVTTAGFNDANATANLSFLFTTQGVTPNPDTTAGPTIPIHSLTWYKFSAVFNTTGNVVAGDGSILGTATVTATPFAGSVLGAPISSSLSVTKTTYGDGLNRPIAIGELGFPSATSALVRFQGGIYNPEVDLLGPVPEPASLATLGLALPALLRRRSRK